MIKKYPKITIVTPSFNQSRYIERTLISVIHQNYPNLEYIVLDGGSTDGSVEIIEKYSKYLSCWRSQKDEGQASVIWEGIKKSEGKIFAWLNSDDIYLPNTLNYVGEYFDNNPDCQILCGNCLKIDKNGKILEKAISAPMQTVHSMIFWGCNCLQPSVFWRKELLLRTGPIDKKLIATFDTEYAIRYTKMAKWSMVNRYLAGIRIHDQTKTNKLHELAINERTQILQRYDYFKVNPIIRFSFKLFYKVRYELYKDYYKLLNNRKNVELNLWRKDTNNADPVV